MSISVEKEYRFALEHRELRSCARLMQLAQLYKTHADHPTLALIAATAEEIRKLPEYPK